MAKSEPLRWWWLLRIDGVVGGSPTAVASGFFALLHLIIQFSRDNQVLLARLASGC